MMLARNTKEPARAGPANVALYVRVSTDKQAKKEDGSLDTQLDQLTAFIEYKRSTGLAWNVTEKLVEGEKDGKRHGKSAKNTNRPALQKLLELARAQLIDVVVITKIDRISRSVVDFLQLVEELDRHGVKVVSLREQIDLTTPAGRFQTVIMIALAQQERELTSVRVKDKVLWRVERGLPIGPPPIGFRMDGKIFGIYEPYASHVRAAETLYLEGESVDKLVVEFRKRGYRTPRGSFYSKQVLCRMLRNEVYIAKQGHHGKLHDAQWKPIRSLETHEQIQRMMDKNDRRHRSGKRQSQEYVYLLQGLLRCGLCGHKMSPRPGRGQSGEYYPYYHCGEAEKTVGGACPRVYVPAKTLDGAILEFLKQLHLQPERIRAIAQQANEFTSGTLTKIVGELERVRAQLAAVRSKLSRLVDVLSEGGKDSLASVRDRMQALEVERTELEETESRLKNEFAAEKTEEVAAAEQIKTLAHFQEIVSTNSEKPDRLKALLPRFVDYVVWHADGRGEGRIEVALFPEPVASTSDLLWTGDPAGPQFAGGSQMVGPARFELATSCTPSRRAKPDCATARWAEILPFQIEADNFHFARARRQFLAVEELANFPAQHPARDGVRPPFLLHRLPRPRRFRRHLDDRADEILGGRPQLLLDAHDPLLLARVRLPPHPRLHLAAQRPVRDRVRADDRRELAGVLVEVQAQFVDPARHLPAGDLELLLPLLLRLAARPVGRGERDRDHRLLAAALDLEVDLRRLHRRHRPGRVRGQRRVDEVAPRIDAGPPHRLPVGDARAFAEVRPGVLVPLDRLRQQRIVLQEQRQQHQHGGRF